MPMNCSPNKAVDYFLETCEILVHQSELYGGTARNGVQAALSCNVIFTKSNNRFATFADSCHKLPKPFGIFQIAFLNFSHDSFHISSSQFSWYSTLVSPDSNWHFSKVRTILSGILFQNNPGFQNSERFLLEFFTVTLQNLFPEFLPSFHIRSCRSFPDIPPIVFRGVLFRSSQEFSCDFSRRSPRMSSRVSTGSIPENNQISTNVYLRIFYEFSSGVPHEISSEVSLEVFQ